MLGSTILEVAIGMFLVYLLVSLILTALTEVISALWRLRARTLWDGIRNLVDSSEADDWVKEFYAHPLIQGLSPGTPEGTAGRTRGPSYIPSRTFVLALLDVIRSRQQAGETLDATLERLRGTRLGGALAVLREDAGQDLERFKENVETWFNHSMDRVGGWYKRKIQAVHLTAGLLLALVLNVDSVLLMRTLQTNSSVRETLVAQAESFVDRPEVQVMASGTPPPSTGDPVADAKRQLAAFQLYQGELMRLEVPVGWTTVRSEEARKTRRIWPGILTRQTDTLGQWGSEWWLTLRYHFWGWLLTALAASLGAPFWFDMLNKVISIRSAGKSPEEKPKNPREVQQPVQPGQTPAEAERLRAARPAGG